MVYASSVAAHTAGNASEFSFLSEEAVWQAREAARAAARYAGELARWSSHDLRVEQSRLREELTDRYRHTYTPVMLGIVNRELYRRYQRGGSTLMFHRRIAAEEV
jgi:hypothetical protein